MDDGQLILTEKALGREVCASVWPDRARSHDVARAAALDVDCETFSAEGGIEWLRGADVGCGIVQVSPTRGADVDR
jgi:hypothetical protein